MADATPFRFTTIAHSGRTLLGPLSEESVDALLARVTLSAGWSRPAVLDIGCGKGEILLRAMRRFGAEGTGIDPNGAFLAQARGRAIALGLADRLTLHECTLAGAPVLAGTADLAVCTGSTHAFGDLRAALGGLRGLVRQGGWALVGTGYWRRRPEAGYLALLGAEEGEMTALAETLHQARETGWTVEAHHESTLAEWDDYEHAYAAAMEGWVATQAADPEAGAFGTRIRGWKDGYTRWGRDTLGFATLLLKPSAVADNNRALPEPGC